MDQVTLVEKKGANYVLLEVAGTINSYTFAGCTNLSNMTLPSGLESIHYHAFKDCKKLSSIVIPLSVQTVDDYIFRDCTMLTTIYCESLAKPINWVDGWKNYCSAQVYWGDEWEYIGGVPTVKD